VTKQPLAVFLDRLRNRFIVSKVAGDKYGDQLYQNLVGTGPYKFVSFQRGGNLVFTRNDDYWGSKAAIKEVIFRKVTEDGARLAALSPARRTSSTMFPSMKWRDCSVIRASESKGSKGCRCIF